MLMKSRQQNKSMPMNWAKLVNIIIKGGALIFILSMAFLTGKGCGIQVCEEEKNAPYYK